MNSKVFLSFMLAASLVLTLNPSLMAETTIQEPQATLNPAAESNQTAQAQYTQAEKTEQPEKTAETTETETQEQAEEDKKPQSKGLTEEQESLIFKIGLLVLAISIGLSL